ncbi:hypothetical protein [Sulfurimonas sp.]|uniref:type II secretion system protein GspD n=1 Tax=Sulfurimonas sp. TaxID=2022749 RepID=UPI0019ECB837|nr:hypothetical protein [Sulfurimonas sp.]MBE0515161.1 hypothetical protein [Sulfurimonas sp.]
MNIHELAQLVSDTNKINIILDPKVDISRNFYFYSSLTSKISLESFLIICESNGFELSNFNSIYYLTLKTAEPQKYDFLTFKNIPFDDLLKLAAFFEVSLVKVGVNKVIVKYLKKESFINFKRFVDSVSAVKQIFLEGEIISVNETNLKDIGIDFASIASSIKTMGFFDTGLFTNINNNKEVQALISSRGLAGGLGDISLFINLLKETGQARVVTRPNMTVMNGEKSIFLSGQKIRIVASSTDSLRPTGEYSSKKFETLNVGLTLSCAADIYDGHAILDFNFEVSDLQEYNPSLGSLVTTTKSYISKFDIKNGEQMMLAGLTTSSTNQYNASIPILGDIPLLGSLFDHTVDKKEDISYLIYFKAVIND